MVSFISRFLALQISTDLDFKLVKNLDKVPTKYITIKDKYIDLICIAGGVTSPNSQYSRTEFREVNENGNNKYWDSDIPIKTMYGRLSVIKLPIIKKSVMFSQIKSRTHGAPLMMFLKDSRVYMVCNTDNFKKRQDIDLNYSLGDIITFKYTVSKGKVSIEYRRNNLKQVKIEYNMEFKSVYFKVGNYMQSKSPPEPKENTSIVRIYNVQISDNNVTTKSKC